MEFKGTKGKWCFNHNLVATIEIRVDDTICLKPAIESYNWEANALLISKAPEMLEMLKRAYASLYISDPDLRIEIYELIKEATEINP